jgi:peptidoglycan hydrolase-like protein with peptidoglycan-binding domain
MIYINASETGLNAGLGKSKFLKKIRIKKIAKQISIKNVVKAAKFAAPIAAGFIPVGGGVASKLMNSKAGKAISKVKSSRLVKKAIAVKKKLPKRAKKVKTLGKGSKGAEVKKLQESLGVEPDGDFGPKTEAALQEATGAKSIAMDSPSYSSNEAEAAYETEEEFATPPLVDNSGSQKKPFGKLTPVVDLAKKMIPQATYGTNEVVQPKNNTLLIVGGVVALAGVAYLATRKK